MFLKPTKMKNIYLCAEKIITILDLTVTQYEDKIVELTSSVLFQRIKRCIKEKLLNKYTNKTYLLPGM